MHVSSLTSPLSLDPNSHFSPIPNSQFITNFNWSFLVQLLVTALILGLGFIHFLRSTAAMAAAAGKEGCAVCGKSTKMWCSACKTVYYCSLVCQREHWKSRHKKNCKKSSGPLKPQQQKGEKAKSSINLVSSSVPVKLVDKVLFPYDAFVKLFHSDLPTSVPCGLLNCGNSCFANVVLQCLAHTRPLVAYLLENGHRRDCKRNEWCFLCELEAHMDRARKSQQPFSPINILSHLPTMGGNMGHGRQEDAHEFMRFAIDMMQSVFLDEHGGEKVILPKSQETTLIQHIFGGQLRSQVKCTRCYHVSNRYESMMDLTVEIQGCATSLQDCLDQFTDIEWLYGENKYRCDRCKAYVDARKRLTIHQAPNILTVTLKRFQGGNFGKINKRVTFSESLDLSPYMSEERDGTDKYELYAVVVHMDMLNASFFGHYICYTKGFQGGWYWIDDCKVERVELEEVLSQGAYMLLYRRISARPQCLKTCDLAMNKDHEGDKIDSVGDDNSPSLKTCDLAMNKNHEGDKIDIVGDDNSPSPKACDALNHEGDKMDIVRDDNSPSPKTCDAMNKDHEGDKMDILGDDNSPSQIASSSNVSEPLTPLSTAVCKPIDEVPEDSHTVPPDSITNQQLKDSGSALVVKDGSARKVEDSLGHDEACVMAPADLTSNCEPSYSIDGLVDIPEQRSVKKITRNADCTTLNF